MEESMEYDFVVETYDTERIKTLSVWSMFADEDLRVRPVPLDETDRNPLEHMVHQCMSENKWFSSMLGIDVGAPPLPEVETRIEFIKRYAHDSGNRIIALREQSKPWWEAEVEFFETKRTRAWVMLRRIAHTAHHRGEQTALLRMLGRSVHSVYGPGAQSGGLPQNGAITLYAYPDIDALIAGEAMGGAKSKLPGPGINPCTERPDGS
jgi:uncharacterized damage-inducible protein DinB